MLLSTPLSPLLCKSSSTVVALVRKRRSGHEGGGRGGPRLLPGVWLTTLIVIITACFSSVIIPHADAITLLASTISTWSNVCNDCEVPSGGTVLAVASMTADANSAGKPAVVFTMTNLLTSGQLTIDCGGSPWGYGIPLLFTVISGSNTPTSTITHFFKIMGTLSVGSSVEIRGGTYHLKYNQVRFMEVSNLQMSSTASIQIKSNILYQGTVGTTPNMYIWSISGLTMASSSSIDHSDNILSLDGAVSTTTSFTYAYMFIWSSCLQMTDTSTFLIKNNTLDAGTFTSVSGSFAIVGIHFRQCVPTFSTSSSLTISKNTYSFVGSTLNGQLSAYWILSDTNSAIFFNSGSSCTLSSNTVFVHSATFGSGVALRNLYFAGTVLVDGVSSILAVSEMIVTFYNISSIPGTLFINAIYAAGSLTIRTAGSLEVADSQVTIGGGGAATTMINELQIGLVRSDKLYVTAGGVVRFNANTILSSTAIVTAQATSGVAVVWTTTSSASAGTNFKMNSNFLEVRNETTAVALFAPGTTISGSSTTNFQHNQLRGPTGRTYLSASGVSFDTVANVCNNTVHDDLCVVASKRRVTGLYSCIPTDTTPIPIVTDVCGKSNTYTDTLPITTTDSTLPAVTPTSLPTRTLTPPSLRFQTRTVSPPKTSTPSAPTPTPGTPSSSIPTSSPSSSPTFSSTPSDPTPTPTPTHTPHIHIPTASSTLVITRTSTVPLTTTTMAFNATTAVTTTPPPPPCTHTCNDIIAAFIVPPSSSSTTDAIVSAYWATYNQSAPRRGCGAVSVGFDATGNGRAVRVLIHVDTGSLTANASYPMLGLPVPATPTSTIRATSLSTNFSGGVVVLEVRRVDATPVTSVTGTITLPAGGFMCSSSGSGGLPTADILFNAPPPSLTTAEQQAVTVVSALSPDLQTVAAMSLLRCSPGDPIDVETEATIRALVPVALSGTCAGAVQGAMLAVVAVGLLCALATSILMKIRKVGWMEAAAVTRCPGVALGVWAFMQMGFVVCGARLVKSDSNGDVALGVVGILLAVILPALCVVLAWKVVSRRCYRIGPTPEVIQSSSKVGLWLRSVLLPEYELDTVVYPVSKAYSTIVGRSRLVGSIWACVPMAQPIIMLVVVFVSGVGCSAVLIAAGVLMLLVAAVCQVWFRPHRIFASNILQAGSMSINATILIIGASLSSNPTHPASLAAFRYVSMMQLGLSVIRLSHTALSAGYMLLRRGASFQRVDPTPTPPQPKNKNIPSSTDQSLLPPPVDDDGVTKVTPVFDYLPHPNAHPHQPDEDPSSQDISHNASPSTSLQKVVSFFTTKKNTRNFNDNIVATVLNNEDSYIPMDRPMQRDGIEMSDNDDGREYDDRSSSSSSSLSISPTCDDDGGVGDDLSLSSSDGIHPLSSSVSLESL